MGKESDKEWDVWVCITKSLCFSPETSTTPWIYYACVCAQSLESYPALCDPMDCSPPGSSVCGILQAKMLEWVAMFSSRGSFQSRNQTLLHLLHWQAVLYHQHHLGSLNQACSNIKLKRETIKERVDNKSKSRVARKYRAVKLPGLNNRSSYHP